MGSNKHRNYEKRGFFKVCGEIMLDVLNVICMWFITSTKQIGNFLIIVTPYLMYYIGYTNRYGIIGWELGLPALSLFTAFFIKSIGNKYNKGSTIPIPVKRFTKIENTGEVTIDQDRLQEVILYLADMEEWLKRKGYTEE